MVINCQFYTQLDEEGKLDSTAGAIFFGENFPTVLRDAIVVKAEPCFKFAGETSGFRKFRQISYEKWIIL